MSRQIEFRAWDKRTGKWHEDWSYLLRTYADNKRFLRITVMPSFEFCQFTGLIDKNGKKIFENDIVRIGQFYDYENGESYWDDESKHRVVWQ